MSIYASSLREERRPLQPCDYLKYISILDVAFPFFFAAAYFVFPNKEIWCKLYWVKLVIAGILSILDKE